MSWLNSTPPNLAQPNPSQPNQTQTSTLQSRLIKWSEKCKFLPFQPLLRSPIASTFGKQTVWLSEHYDISTVKLKYIYMHTAHHAEMEKEETALPNTQIRDHSTKNIYSWSHHRECRRNVLIWAVPSRCCSSPLYWYYTLISGVQASVTRNPRWLRLPLWEVHCRLNRHCEI